MSRTRLFAKVLSQKRKEILKIIKDNPAITFNKLSKMINKGNGCLDYHLKVLEDDNIIKSYYFNNHRYLFEHKYHVDNLELFMSDIEKQILSLLRSGKSNKDIMKETELSKQSVNYYKLKLKRTWRVIV